MLITEKTRTKKVLPLLNEDNIDSFIDSFPEVEFNFFSMTIEEFAELVEDEQKWVYSNIIEKNKKAVDCFGKIKHIKKCIDNLNRFLQMNSVPRTEDEKRAANNVTGPTFVESILITLVEFFHLQSFDEAGKKTLADFMLVYKKLSSDAKINYNYSRIIQSKTNKKH